MGWWPGRRMRTDIGFGAFISYSGQEDRALIAKLQNGIEKLAKRWYRPPVMKVFVDKTSISAGTRLWGRIEAGLSRSRWLILFASPEAAESWWVNREVEWWLAQRPIDNLVIVHTAGRLSWDRETRDFAADSTALPPCLRGAFADEPVWVSVLRDDRGADLDKVVLNVASTVRGVPIHELSSQAYREHRRTMRWAAGAIGALSLLLVAALVLSYFAVTQKQAADRQATLALARQLAATSGTSLSSNPRASMILAASAFRIDANPQTFTALMRADTANPKLVRYVLLDRPVESLDGSGDGTVAVAGLDDGGVERLDLAGRTSERVLALSGPVTMSATNSDGSVVVASDGSAASVWRAGEDVESLPIATGQRITAVAVSPSGRTVVVHYWMPEQAGGHTDVVFRGAATSAHPSDAVDPLFTSFLTVPSDDEVLLFDGSRGNWERRRISDWSPVGSGSVGLGLKQYPAAPSADGEFLSATNGSTTIPVWRARGATDPDHPGLTAQAPIDAAGPIALSPDGMRMALVNAGSIFVAAVAPEAAAFEVATVCCAARPPGPPIRPPTVELPAAGAVAFGNLRFLGDGTHLLSATGNQIALWDLEQIDRLARLTTTGLTTSPCSGCNGTPVVVSPDGTRALLANEMDPWAVFPMPGHEGRPQLLHGLTGLPIWEDDGTLLVLTAPDLAIAPVSGVRIVPVDGADQLIAGAVYGAAGQIVAVDRDGRIFLLDHATGEVRETIPSPSAGKPEDFSGRDADVNPLDGLVARVQHGEATVFDLVARREVGAIPGADVLSARFAGDSLLVQRQSGNLEVWDGRGTARKRVLLGDSAYYQAPVADRSGRIVARLNGGYGIDLFDLETGAFVNSIPPRPGSYRTNYAFAPNDLELVTTTDYPYGSPQAAGGAELTVRDLAAPALLSAACTAAGGNLSAEEWTSLAGVADPGASGC